MPFYILWHFLDFIAELLHFIFAEIPDIFIINFLKQIDVLYQNEEYTIVKTGTTYGIALYDHIALDGTKIDENKLIK